MKRINDKNLCIDFEKKQNEKAIKVEKWKEKREEAYLGSMTHFMKGYYHKTLGQDGYKIELLDEKTKKFRSLNDPYDTAFATLADGDLELHPSTILRIIYLNETPEQDYLVKNKLALNNTVQISQLTFRDAILVEQNGYCYDQKDILSIGYWAWEKIADLMPYDY
ncbi:MAG: hypothetical protein ACOVOS_06505 [Chitinophagaceae bacterium]